MSKIKLQVHELQKGMYVSELDRPWGDTSFLFQGFRITNAKEIEALRKTCEFVFLDQEKSTIDVSAHNLSLEEEKKSTKYKNIEPLHNIEIKHKPHNEQFDVEFPRAKSTYLKSSKRVQDIIDGLRFGRALDVLSVKSTVQELTGSILRNPDALKLLCVLEEREGSAVNHALHVCILTLAFAYYLGLKKDMIQQLGIGALLHDIGESKLPDNLFWQSDIYSEDEKNIVARHTEYGSEIITNTPGLHPLVLDIVQSHHERLNGTGFPQQACGSEISYNAMLVSIVDVYDSVTMGYEGKQAISCTDALKSMYDWRGELFQTDLVEHFIQCMGIYPIGSVVKLNTGEIGIVVTFDDYSRLTPRVMLLLDKQRNQYPVPRILNLSRFKDEDEKFIYEIETVVNPQEYGIDIRHHILRELYVDEAVNMSNN